MSARRGSFAVESALAAVLLCAAIAFGAVHGWALGLLEIALAALAAGVACSRRARRLPPGILWSGLLLYAYLAAQMVPLPRGLIATLSPGTDSFRQQTADRLLELPPSPVAADEPSERARQIDELSRDRGGWFPESWVPLSLYPFATRTDLLEYLALGAAFWIAATVRSPRVLLGLAFAVGTLVATFGLVEFATWNGHLLWFFEPYETGVRVDFDRMVGPFVNPDHFAFFVAISIPLGAGLLVDRRRGRDGRPRPVDPLRSSGVGLALAVMLAALIGAASRGALIGVMLGLTLLWWSRATRSVPSPAAPRRHRRRPLDRARELANRFGPALAVLAIVVVGAVYAGGRARSTLDTRVSEAFVSPEQFELRELFVRQSLGIVRDFPLFGVGAGCWAEVFRRYEAFPLVGHVPNHLHDDYLEWLTETGIVGVLVAGLLLLQIARVARRNDSVPRALRWAILGALTTAAFHETLDFGLRVPANALLATILVGLLCNGSWRRDAEPPVPAAGRAPLAVRFAAVSAALAFGVLAIGQIREFWQWASVRGGSTMLRFAPDDGDTWNRLGVLLIQDGPRSFPTAARCLRAAIARRPGSGAAFWALSFTTDRTDEQLRWLASAVFLDPTNAQGRLRHAHVLDVVGRGPEALQEVEEAVRRDPRLPSHPYVRADGHGLGAPMKDAVRRGFEGAVVARPHDAYVLHQAASFDRWFGHPLEAGALWQRAADASDQWDVYGPLAGESYAAAGDWATAEAVLRRAIDANPKTSEGYRVLAMAVLRPQRRYADAEATLRLGADRSSEGDRLLRSLAALEHEKGDLRAATEALVRAADLRPLDPAIQAELGKSYLEAENWHLAEMAFERAIAIAPADASFHFALGVAQERRYALSEALDSYRRAAQLEPRNEIYASALARLQAQSAKTSSSS